MTELHLTSKGSKSTSSPLDEWYVVSGANKHVTGHREALSHLEPETRSQVSTAGGEILHVAGRGNIEFPTTLGKINFESVLYIPGITKNLLSVGAIAVSHPGRMVLFNSRRVWVLNDLKLPCPSKILATGYRNKKNGLYRVRPPDEQVLVVTAPLQGSAASSQTSSAAH